MRKALLLLAALAASSPLLAQGLLVSVTTGGASTTVAPGGNVALKASDLGQPVLATVNVRFNGSSNSATLTGVSVSGTSEITLLQAPAAQPLGPGASVSFNVQYLPTSGNSVTGQVAIGFSDGVQISTFLFSITGTSPRLTYSYFISPNGAFTDLNSGDRITFPTTNLGSSLQAVFTVFNRGSAAGSIQSVTVSGAAFQISGSTAPLALPPGQQTTFNITFTPSSIGGALGLLTLNLPSSGVTFPLAGTGANNTLTASYALADGNNHLLASGTPITFPSVDVNGNTTATVTIQNQGTGPGTLNAVSIAGTGFALTGLPLLPSSIPAGQSVRFNIVFNPTQSGAFSGTYRIDLGGSIIAGTLAGSTNNSSFTASYALADGNLRPLPSGTAIVFPSVDVNGTTTATITLLNQGPGSGTVTGITVAGTGFQLTGVPLLPATIPATQSTKFNIVFAPNQAGPFSGTFRIDFTGGSISGSLSGSTSTGNFAVSYTLNDGNIRPISSGTVIAFPQVDINATSTAGVTILNQGPGSGVVTAITVSGTGFQLTGLPLLPATVPANQSTRFNIVFSPTQAGSFNGTFTIAFNNGATITGSLSGSTNASNFSVSYTIGSSASNPLGNGGVIAFPAIDVNATSTAVVTILNQGPGTGIVSGIFVNGNGFQLTGVPVLPATVPSGGTVRFNIVLNTTQAGTYTGTFQIALTGAPLSGTMTETTAASNITLAYLDPDTSSSIAVANNGTIQFPNTVSGAVSNITIVATNTGAGTGTIDAVSLGGTSASAFQILNLPPLPATVAPAAQVRFGIRFSPQQQQAFTGTLLLSIKGQTIAINLAAQGIAPQFTYSATGGGSVMPFTPDGTLTVPDTSVGQTATLTITVTNSGNADGQISGFAVTGTGFSLTGAPAAAVTLKVGASQQFNLTFAPTQPGPATGRLTIGAATFTLASNGIGSKLIYSYTNAAASNPLAEGGSVIFTPAAVGNTQSLNFSIQNTGTIAATISSINLTAASSIFALQQLPSLPLNLNPGSSVSFTVNFSPNNTGTLTATLAVNSTNFILSGNGTPPPALPGYQFQGPSGTQQPAQQPTLGLTLASPYAYALKGTLVLTFASSVFTDDPSIQFANGGRTISFTIPANSTQALFNGSATTVPLQTGTTAGNIVVTPTFAMQSGFDVTPTSPSTLTLTIQKTVPQLLNATVTSQTLTSFAVILSGYSTGRNLRQLDIQVSPASGSNFSTTHLTVDITSASTTWFQGTASQGFGGAFLVSIPFNLQNGSTTDNLVHQIQSLSITATNDVGASSAISVPIP